jgi:hypothetical protein
MYLNIKELIAFKIHLNEEIITHIDCKQNSSEIL